MNAIELLKQQHEKTKDALERVCEGNVDKDELRLLADELVAHMVIEEHAFYPRIRQLDQGLVKESFEEHAIARFELARAMLATGDEQLTRLGVLKELLEHHIEEEEEDLFPKVMKAIPTAELETLGARMEAMFDKAVEAGLERLVVATGDLQQVSTAKARSKPAATRPSGSKRTRSRMPAG